jgi:DNA-binding NarL/FixJ family response regulator
MHEEREIAQRMIEAGAGAFLTKGGPSQQLIGAIRDTCRRKADTPRPVQ